MKIREVTDHRKAYLDLLLLADEQEDMIDCFMNPAVFACTTCSKTFSLTTTTTPTYECGALLVDIGVPAKRAMKSGVPVGAPLSVKYPFVTERLQWPPRSASAVPRQRWRREGPPSGDRNCRTGHGCRLRSPRCSLCSRCDPPRSG